MISIGVIPARGGSKSIPLKNIKKLNGKPLIEYTIEVAIKSKMLDRIIVSTDHDEIAKVCKKYSEVDVFLRPDNLSIDTAKTEPVLLHVCDELQRSEGLIPDFVLTLEPTSPMRKVDTIRRCLELINRPHVDSVLAVTETREVYGQIKNGAYQHLIPNQPRRRQDRAPIYRESSTIYGTTLKVLRETNSVIGGEMSHLIVDKKEAIDINDIYDFMLAEVVLIDLDKED
jgi:CMP-N,N'-diacetyllegionaminic acid synthase